MNFSWTIDDVICTDKYLSAYPGDYVKTDLFYTSPIHWRGRVVYPPPPTQHRIIAGHSDHPVTDEIVKRYPTATWFSVNTQSVRVTGLPLGITNDTDESSLHRIYGNVQMMFDVAHQPRVIKNLVYLNITAGIYNNPVERGMVKAMFRDVPWVTSTEPVNTLDGRRAFLQDIRSHDFVLCPAGNGVDTHRLWETLYMGSIPIVKRDIAHSGWTDLPILFVDDWAEVTYDRLIAERARILSTTWNLEKLRVGYWIDRIQQTKQ